MSADDANVTDDDDSSPHKSRAVHNIVEARLRIADLQQQLAHSQQLATDCQLHLRSINAINRFDWQHVREIVGDIRSQITDRHPTPEPVNEPDPAYRPARFCYRRGRRGFKMHTINLYECAEADYRVIRSDPRLAYHPALIEAMFTNFKDPREKPSCRVVARQYVIFCLPSSCEERRRLQREHSICQAMSRYICANPHRTSDRRTHQEIHSFITFKFLNDEAAMKNRPDGLPIGRVTPDPNAPDPVGKGDKSACLPGPAEKERGKGDSPESVDETNPTRESIAAEESYRRRSQRHRFDMPKSYAESESSSSDSDVTVKQESPTPDPMGKRDKEATPLEPLIDAHMTPEPLNEPDPAYRPPRHTTAEPVNEPDPTYRPARFRDSGPGSRIHTINLYECAEADYRVIRLYPRLAYHPALIEAMFTNFKDPSEKPSCRDVSRQYVIFCLPSSCEERRRLQREHSICQAMSHYIYAHSHRTADRLEQQVIHRAILGKFITDEGSLKNRRDGFRNGRVTPDSNVPDSTAKGGKSDFWPDPAEKEQGRGDYPESGDEHNPTSQSIAAEESYRSQPKRHRSEMPISNAEFVSSPSDSYATVNQASPTPNPMGKARQGHDATRSVHSRSAEASSSSHRRERKRRSVEARQESPALSDDFEL